MAAIANGWRSVSCMAVLNHLQKGELSKAFPIENAFDNPSRITIEGTGAFFKRLPVLVERLLVTS